MASTCQDPLISQSMLIRANTAESSTVLSESNEPSIAVRNAERSVERKKWSASYADRFFEQKHQMQKRAPENAQGVSILKIEKLSSPQKVYNLSVAETPEYFAEGILVHNCIAAAGSWLVYSKDKIVAKVDSSEENRQNPEYGSFLWRERQERSEVDSGGPEYGIRDVLRY